MKRRAAVILFALLLTAATLTPPAAVAVSPGAVEAVSVGAEGNNSAGPASSPAVSADGSQVAFESRASLDPVVQPGASTPYNVYVRDRRTPAHTVLISRALPTTSFAARGSSAPRRAAARLEESGGNGDSVHPAVSATGRYVAFESVATDLRAGYGLRDRRVVICDRDPDNDGIFDELRPDGLMDFGYLVLPPTGPEAVTGSDPSLSADGTVVAWREEASDSHLAVVRLTLDPQGRPLPPDPDSIAYPAVEGSAGAPQVSADGSQVVFAAGGCPSSFACPAATGSIQAYDVTTRRNTRIDYLPDGSFSGTAGRPAVSGSGRVVAYEHRVEPNGPTATIVVDRDPNGTGRLGPGPDATVSASIASRDTSGRSADGTAPALSADGRYLAFESSADGMYDDAQGTSRTAIVLRDLTLDTAREKAGQPRLPGELGSPAATACAGKVCPAHGPSGSPRLSANGAVVVFTSAGDDVITPACCAGAVFARILQPRVAATTTVFGTVPVGGSATRTITVQHTGFGPLTIASLRVDGAADFVVGVAENCVGATLHEAEACQIAVDFRPGSTGAKQAVLRIGQGDGTVIDIPLRGNAEPVSSVPPSGPAQPAPAGGLVVTPDPVDFGGDQPALVPVGDRSVEIRNAATVPITVSAIGILTGPRLTAGEFAVLATTCAGAQLAPGSTCTANLRATPQAGGRRSGVLAITTADPTYTRLVELTSQAAEPTVVVNPAVVRTNRVTLVAGRDFPPGRRVTLTLTTPGSRLQTSVVAGADGRWSAPLLVFPQTSAGTWPAVASVDGTTIRAQATVLIEPGSYQPPDFTSRR